MLLRALSILKIFFETSFQSNLIIWAAVTQEFCARIENLTVDLFIFFSLIDTTLL